MTPADLTSQGLRASLLTCRASLLTLTILCAFCSKHIYTHLSRPHQVLLATWHFWTCCSLHLPSPFPLLLCLINSHSSSKLLLKIPAPGKPSSFSQIIINLPASRSPWPCYLDASTKQLSTSWLDFYLVMSFSELLLLSSLWCSGTAF